jgi:NADH:ubiquinone oxidoreductase subunit F (NADH-binding)/NAD-dependent dihydropyrimidine dehydrogenase PreA subunit
MDKLTLETLANLRKKIVKTKKDFIAVGLSSCGIAAGAGDVYEYLKQAIEEKGLDVELKKTGCAGMCYAEPLVEVNTKALGRVIYNKVDIATAKKIVEQHLQNKEKIEDKIYQSQAKQKQLRIVLGKCGVIDPESIQEYIAHEGYRGLSKVLKKYSAEDVIEQLKVSGLRGRGGGGFPTWMKWNFAKKVDSSDKYIICNGDEGDPGAYMDRSVLEGNPHGVIEGMIIAGFTVGARKGFFYIRAEYPLAIKRVNKAIEQAREYGILGDNILGTDFSFDLEIRLGAGAFVCGEETALIASIEGRRGYPSVRPPYPSVKGLWTKPTVINNVETLANIGLILDRGGEWFSGIGTDDSSGTKIFALTGKIKNSGLIEVPMGLTLREIVFDVGGGIAGDKNIKAVQTGGPSGGVIPAELLDTPVDYGNLQKIGSIMGSGGMIVMDDTDCMVDIAKFYMKFCVEESCGKCAPGRIGTYQMLNYLEKITQGQAQVADLEKLQDIASASKKAALCGLGQTAPNPVISTLRYFRSEYLQHINNKRCPAGKCKDLAGYVIIADKCKRCGLCLKSCPVGAISGSKEEGFYIDPDKCIRCGKCFEVCKFKAIKRG